jgi:hypothetical protein
MRLRGYRIRPLCESCGLNRMGLIRGRFDLASAASVRRETCAASHPDFNRRSRSFTGSTADRHRERFRSLARGLSPPVRIFTDPGARCNPSNRPPVASIPGPRRGDSFVVIVRGRPRSARHHLPSSPNLPAHNSGSAVAPSMSHRRCRGARRTVPELCTEMRRNRYSTVQLSAMCGCCQFAILAR